MLVLDRLALTYPDFSVLYDLRVPRGALCSLIGPSGGGKTTLLHAVAGFAKPTSGSVSFDGVDLTHLPPAERPLTMLFQEHNLFPHLTAAQNIGLGLDPRLRLTAAQKNEVENALARVDLPGLGARRPSELSGGQRQRVAIARAIVRDKPLMLLDEPFTGLDPGLRQDMIALVDTLRGERGLTVVMSIHTPADAAAVSDVMAFIDEGRVTAAGTPQEILAARSPGLDRYFRR